MIVETALQKKGTKVATLTLEATVADAAALLLEKHVGIIVVCDAEHRVIGVITDSDIMSCVASCESKVCCCIEGIDEVMSRNVVTCKSDDKLDDIWRVMKDLGLRRIPVVDDDGKLSGIINIRDIFRFLRQEKRLEAHELELIISPPIIHGAHMTDVLDTLHQEHRRIATALVCLRQLVASIGDAGRAFEIDLLNAVLDYIEAFPDTIHHPKEEDFLFEALRRRKPDEAGLLDQLIREHTIGDGLLAELRLSLQGFQDDPSNLAELQRVANHYVEFENAHMRQEENVFMPLAARYLRTDDWVQIDEAFRRDDDPLFGQERRAEFDELFKYIVEHVPNAPVEGRAD